MSLHSVLPSAKFYRGKHPGDAGRCSIPNLCKDYSLVGPKKRRNHLTIGPTIPRFLGDMVSPFQLVSNTFATHEAGELGSGKAARNFRQTRQTAKKTRTRPVAVRWRDQNIPIDISGTLAKEWETRKHAATFAHL